MLQNLITSQQTFICIVLVDL